MISYIKGLINDKGFLRNTAVIAIPVMFQSMLNMLTNMLDTLMIGRLGENAVGGVGLASKVFYVFLLIVLGVSSGVSILISQYWGNSDKKRIREVTGLGLVISLFAGIVFWALAFFRTDAVMGILTTSPSLLKEGSDYLRIVCFTYPLIAVTTILLAQLKATEQVKAPVIISGTAILTNVIFNYILIFGHFGVPALGVKGAAYATLIARLVELMLTFVGLKKTGSVLMGGLKDMMSMEKAVAVQFARTSVPVILNETFWGVGIAMYSVVYGRMGESAAAVMTIVGTYGDIEVVGMQGLSTATAVLMGKEMGAGKLEDAKKHASYDLFLALVIGLFLTVVTILIRKPYISLFAVSKESARSIYQCLMVFAVSLVFRSQNFVMVLGILRSGGDTVACALLDDLPMWLVGIPLIFLTGLKLNWPLWAVYIFANIDEFIKCFVGHARYRTFKWLKNLNAELTQIKDR